MGRASLITGGLRRHEVLSRVERIELSVGGAAKLMGVRYP